MIQCTDQIKFTFCVCCDTGNSLDRLERKRRLHSLHWDEVQTIQVLSCNSWLNMHQSSRVLQPENLTSDRESQQTVDLTVAACHYTVVLIAVITAISAFDLMCKILYMFCFLEIYQRSGVMFYCIIVLYNVLPDLSISTQFMFWRIYLPVHHHGMPPHYYCN